jgi:enoyl-CoA hydratase/carnithine racemase
MAHLTVSFDSRFATIILDHPPQNRIDDQMVDERATALTAIERSDAQVVIVRSEGNDFSFGGDILPWPEASPHELRARFEHYMSAFNRLERTSLPVIAARSGQMCPPRGRREAGRSTWR